MVEMMMMMEIMMNPMSVPKTTADLGFVASRKYELSAMNRPVATELITSSSIFAMNVGVLRYSFAEFILERSLCRVFPVVVVVVDVACYSVAAVWGATLGLGFVMYHLGCSTSVTAGEHSIAIRSYGTPVVIGVSRYCVGVTGCVSFCARALLDTGSARAQNQ